MGEITLTFGQGSDESDVGLGYIYSCLSIDTETKEIDWDIFHQDRQFGHPKSEKPEDVLEFVSGNYGNFHEPDSTIDLVCEILSLWSKGVYHEV